MDVKKNPENSSTMKANIFHQDFISIGNIHNVHRGKDYMKIFCESLIKHVMKIIN